ncbi:phospho-sugar mutase, partial [Propionibacterium sp.]|uniref:phospho-sugar mutase n=1 Tax=Propionibacterium sp. TaxID=1977903 RepID=UPI0039EBAC62
GLTRGGVGRAGAGVAAGGRAREGAGAWGVMGHDARHGAARCARDSTEVMAAAGLDVVLVEDPVPTPVIAFGVRHLGAAAGIVVTASHNPAADNGYKVYDDSGSQIIPPSDLEISGLIEQACATPPKDLARSDDWRRAGPELVDAYCAAAVSLASPQAGGSPDAELRWVHTAMHGVGAELVTRVSAEAGFPEPIEVPEQAAPDPDFPTLPFPNPEEPGAMDLAMALARGTGADLAIATDPDADRCAVAIPGPTGWRRLTGDELGSVLADDAVRRGAPGVLARSVVSGSQIDSIAAAASRNLVTTPTGFKWIGRVPELAFGYEEAIGYCCDPAHVADKDGISATVAVLRTATALKAEGRTLGDRLDEIDRAHGVHLTSQVAWRVDDHERISAAMALLRSQPRTTLGGVPVSRRDLLVAAGTMPAIDALEFSRPGVRVFVRPSGTEPKLKCYLEIIADPSHDGGDLEICRARASQAMSALRAEVATLVDLS